MPEPGEDLASLLARMRPALSEAPCVFVTRPRVTCEELEAALGSFREDEGVTLILEEERAARPGLEARPRWARITLTVHSSLSAVGLIANVATALAEAGISCNPMSAWYHDHLFVPWEQRQAALEALQQLSTSSPRDAAGGGAGGGRQRSDSG
ncbi:MAG: hypothetical protein DLM67_18605 [Candidatus Nephthysia bennettiae]|nr:MAG: hypothetical protein DLM67_18605 [Candidatus Dormibacteraeota bacterium]